MKKAKVCLLRLLAAMKHAPSKSLTSLPFEQHSHSQQRQAAIVMFSSPQTNASKQVMTQNGVTIHQQDEDDDDEFETQNDGETSPITIPPPRPAALLFGRRSIPPSKSAPFLSVHQKPLDLQPEQSPDTPSAQHSRQSSSSSAGAGVSPKHQQSQQQEQEYQFSITLNDDNELEEDEAGRVDMRQEQLFSKKPQLQHQHQHEHHRSQHLSSNILKEDVDDDLFEVEDQDNEYDTTSSAESDTVEAAQREDEEHDDAGEQEDNDEIYASTAEQSQDIDRDELQRNQSVEEDEEQQQQQQPPRQLPVPEKSADARPQIEVQSHVSSEAEHQENKEMQQKVPESAATAAAVAPQAPSSQLGILHDMDNTSTTSSEDDFDDLSSLQVDSMNFEQTLSSILSDHDDSEDESLASDISDELADSEYETIIMPKSRRRPSLEPITDNITAQLREQSQAAFAGESTVSDVQEQEHPLRVIVSQSLPAAVERNESLSCQSPEQSILDDGPQLSPIVPLDEPAARVIRQNSLEGDIAPLIVVTPDMELDPIQELQEEEPVWNQSFGEANSPSIQLLHHALRKTFDSLEGARQIPRDQIEKIFTGLQSAEVNQQILIQNALFRAQLRIQPKVRGRPGASFYDANGNITRILGQPGSVGAGVPMLPSTLKQRWLEKAKHSIYWIVEPTDTNHLPSDTTQDDAWSEHTPVYDLKSRSSVVNESLDAISPLADKSMDRSFFVLRHKRTDKKKRQGHPVDAMFYQCARKKNDHSRYQQFSSLLNTMVMAGKENETWFYY